MIGPGIRHGDRADSGGRDGTEYRNPARLKIMTYNVHSCVGMDGEADPSRIARVIQEYEPDVVALQELDSGLARTGMVDQARVIAGLIEMDHHFHPSIRIESGQYGNAFLTQLPARMVHAGELPTLPGRKIKELRGAIWLKVSVGGGEVDIINTHLGLNRHERLAQAAALKGPEWLGSEKLDGPVVVCGDMNSSRWSGVYRVIGNGLVDACPGRTWPGRFPLFRLDYMFVSPDVTVRSAETPRTPLTAMASDHLPVIATLELPWRAEY